MLDPEDVKKKELTGDPSPVSGSHSHYMCIMQMVERVSCACEGATVDVHSAAKASMVSASIVSLQVVRST